MGSHGAPPQPTAWRTIAANIDLCPAVTGRALELPNGVGSGLAHQEVRPSSLRKPTSGIASPPHATQGTLTATTDVVSDSAYHPHLTGC